MESRLSVVGSVHVCSLNPFLQSPCISSAVWMKNLLGFKEVNLRDGTWYQSCFPPHSSILVMKSLPLYGGWLCRHFLDVTTCVCLWIQYQQFIGGAVMKQLQDGFACVNLCSRRVCVSKHHMHATHISMQFWSTSLKSLQMMYANCISPWEQLSHSVC